MERKILPVLIREMYIPFLNKDFERSKIILDQKFYLLVMVLNLTGQQACSMDHGQRIDLVLFYTVNDPAGFFDQLADIFGLVTGNLAARIWLVADLL